MIDDKKSYLSNKKSSVSMSNGIEDKAENLIMELKELKSKMEKKIDFLSNGIEEFNDDNNKILSSSGYNNQKDINVSDAKLVSSNMLSYYSDRIKHNIEEKKEIAKETSTLSNMLYNYSTSNNNFNASSNKEYSSFWILRVLISVLILTMSVVSYFLFNPILAKVNVSNMEIFFRSLPMIMTFTLIVYYVFMEKQHFKRATLHKDLSLKLSLLDMYLMDVPKNESDLIKVELAKYFFHSISNSK